MRYSLRNKDKIKKSLGDDKLNQIIKELDYFFNNFEELSITLFTKKDAKGRSFIDYDDFDGTYYILGITYDVYNLAYSPKK